MSDALPTPTTPPTVSPTLGHRLEALGARGLLSLLRRLGPERASALGAHLLRAVGPRLRAQRVARDNLARAFPDLDPATRERLLPGMWNNLGRTLGEMPHLEALSRLDGPWMELDGAEILADLKASGRPILFFGAHIANWEIGARVLAQHGVGMNVFFRAPNNPLILDIYGEIRGAGFGRMLPKGRDGARAAFACLKRGENLGILVDQKMNDGIAVPFFGHDAMTAPALAQLAKRFDALVVPLRTRRLDGPRQRVSVHAPLDLPDSGDRHADVAETMRRVNVVLEGWIRETPEQWLWVHRRWPKG